MTDNRKRNPDQIDASLWQNDSDRDLTELHDHSSGGFGGCGCGTFLIVYIILFVLWGVSKLFEWIFGLLFF